MSAMAAPPPRLDSVLSFSADHADAARPAAEEVGTTPAFSDAGSDADDDDSFEFEFAFAPPLAAADLSPADDLFARGRILPAYPVFDRRHLLLDEDDDQPTPPLPQASSSSSTAPPSPDTYCEWAPRSAPGSPARREFPKSASTGDARRSWRLRDLVAGGGGRSHSDGKEKFHFLQPTTTPSKTAADKPQTAAAAAAKASAPARQSKTKKGAKAAAVTEMDMATAHRLFYGKQGGGALAGDRQKQSYLPYRPGIVGFFTAAHALGRSHHPY